MFRGPGITTMTTANAALSAMPMLIVLGGVAAWLTMRTLASRKLSLVKQPPAPRVLRERMRSEPRMLTRRTTGQDSFAATRTGQNSFAVTHTAYREATKDNMKHTEIGAQSCSDPKTVLGLPPPRPLPVTPVGLDPLPVAV